MFKTLLYSGLGLGACLFGPYMFHSASNYVSDVQQSASEASTAAPVAQAAPEQKPADMSVAAPDGTLQPLPPLAGQPVRDFGEVFRFDISTRWIAQRWPHVSTGLAQMQLHGFRVPLVTGTDETDLAGSLTYYFGPQQRVERLVFHGTTGDPSRLLSFLARRYRFVHRPVNDAGVYIYEAVTEDGGFAGSAEIRSSWTIRASQPLQRYELKLQLERPT